MIKNFEQLKEMLKAMPVKRKVAVVPAQDEHTLEAISHAYRDGMVEPVLIGDEPKIREILAQIGIGSQAQRQPLHQKLMCRSL